MGGGYHRFHPGRPNLIQTTLEPSLTGPYIEDKMQEKKYLILLDINARKRHYHAIEAGKIIKFVIQLELKSGGVWKEVIRYDCAHDYAHKDCYNVKGKCRKINLYLDYEDALTLADDDINENWEIYRERFLRGDFP